MVTFLISSLKVGAAHLIIKSSSCGKQIRILVPEYQKHFFYLVFLDPELDEVGYREWAGCMLYTGWHFSCTSVDKPIAVRERVTLV
jgi:hypothetical protein